MSQQLTVSHTSRYSEPPSAAPVLGRPSHSQTYPAPSTPSTTGIRARSASPYRHNYSAPATLPSESLTMAATTQPNTKPINATTFQKKPLSPGNLTVEIVANQKLYIEWSYVNTLDHNGKSNGTTVTGFRVIVF